MRHRGPKNIQLTTSDRPTNIRAGRRALAISAALASLAGSGIAVAIGTSMAAPTPAPTGVNLIANPGFERGLTGWTSSKSTVTTGSAHRNGVHSAVLGTPVVAAAAASKKRPNATTETLTTDATAPTVAGGVYHMVVWAAAPNGAAHAVVKLRELHAGTVVGQQVARWDARNARWHAIAVTYRAAAAGDVLQLSIVASSLTPGHRLLADDVALTLASDPTPSATDTGTPTPTTTPTVTPTPTPTPTTTPTTTPTPPPTGGPALIGTSFGGSVAATEAQFPNMAVARFYYPGAPRVWGGSMATIPASQVIIVSFNYPAAATAAGAYDASFTQVLRSWAASGRTIYWNWEHEADNPAKGISQASYRAAWDRLLADAAAVNAPNLHSMSIIMAIALTGVHGPVEGWYVPGVDVVGFDSYYLSTELLAEQYAAAKGKPLAFPEFGSSIGGSSDATSAAFARQFIAALDSNTIAAVWFDNMGNNLSSHPATLAVLRAAAR